MASQAGQIETNALAPMSAEVDGAKVQQFPIPGQIQADQYAAQAAAMSLRHRGVYKNRGILPGAFGGRRLRGFDYGGYY